MLRRMVFRSLLNNVRIFAWTLLTLTTCAALITLFATATLEVGKKMSRDLRRLGANAVAYPSGPKADWSRFEAVAGAHAASTATLSAQVGIVNGRAVAVVAADPVSFQRLTPYWSVSGARPRTSLECLVGRRAADVLHLKIGDRIAPAGSVLRVVGIAETGDEDDDRLFVVPPAAGATGFRYVLLSVGGGAGEMTRLQQAVAASGAGIQVKPFRQILHGEKVVLDKINVLFLATLTAVLALTALGVSASMLARVVERRKEFALLQALGARKAAIVRFLLAESATVGAIGSVLGFVIGTLLAWMIVWRIFHVTVTPQWTACLAAAGTTVFVSLLAGGIACGRTLRFRPAAALRGE